MDRTWVLWIGEVFQSALTLEWLIISGGLSVLAGLVATRFNQCFILSLLVTVIFLAVSLVLPEILAGLTDPAAMSQAFSVRYTVFADGFRNEIPRILIELFMNLFIIMTVYGQKVDMFRDVAYTATPHDPIPH